jgi:polygalacturonase
MSGGGFVKIANRSIGLLLLLICASASIAIPGEPAEHGCGLLTRDPGQTAAGGAVAAAGVYDVRAYGAAGDGKTLDTTAVNKAIDVAAAAGGGTVRFTAGTYLCHSIHLKSNIALYLDQGATILAADAPPEGSGGGYDPAELNQWDKYQDFGHSHWHNSLIWGEGIENVSILGPGLIYGRGLITGDNPRAGVGDKMIALKLCRNVIIRDISILRGGHFGILATGVDNLTIDNLKIDTNRDGFNVDCCRNVRISNCSVNSPADDGICLKSSYALGFARATENVTITNCQLSGYDVGSFLDGTFRRGEKGSHTGRIKFGTESNGGFKNITITNCIFDYCCGLALETVDGGLLEDVSITNITMRDIVNAPIFLRLGSRMRGPEGTPVGALRRVIISNIVVYNADPRYGSIISGIPGHAIEDVKLSNIRIFSRGGGTKEQAALEPPENERNYPEPSMFGQIPAYGFFIRHAEGIELSNVEISYLKEDLRPALMLSDVRGADFFYVKAGHAPDVPTFVLKSVENFSTHQCGLLPDMRLERVDQKKF